VQDVVEREAPGHIVLRPRDVFYVEEGW